MFYTYKITCTVTGKIYFGYTSSSIEQRFNRHCHERRLTLIRNSINKYGREKHTIELIKSHTTDHDAKTHEIELIETYMTNARRYPESNGLNMTDGGEGAKGYKFTDEQKTQMKEQNKAWYSGSHNKKVYQFYDTGELICEHKSAKAAATAVGAHGADISKCCRQLIRTVKGFFFSYEPNGANIREKLPKNSPLKKQVILTTNKDEKITCTSIAEAQSIVHTSRGNILKAIRTKKPIKGFFVQLADQEHLPDPQSLQTLQPS